MQCAFYATVLPVVGGSSLVPWSGADLEWVASKLWHEKKNPQKRSTKAPKMHSLGNNSLLFFLLDPQKDHTLPCPSPSFPILILFSPRGTVMGWTVFPQKLPLSSNPNTSACDLIGKCACVVRVRVLNHFSCIQLFVTLWTVAHQAALSLGILQTRILEWVSISYSMGSYQLRGQTWVSCIASRSFTAEPPGKPIGKWGL